MLRMFPMTKVSAAIYLSPPVTMIWGWMLFSEPLTVAMFIGLVVTLIGVWLTSRRLSFHSAVCQTHGCFQETTKNCSEDQMRWAPANSPAAARARPAIDESIVK